MTGSLQPTDDTTPHLAVRYGIALGLAAVATALALAAERWVAAPNLSLVFVLPVVICAAAYGWGPALTAAVTGALGFNFFLIDPRYTLRVADPSNGWAIGLLIVVATIVSAVAARSRGRALESRRHAAQADALQDLARSLVGAVGAPAIAQAATKALADLFDAPAVVLVSVDGALEPMGATAGADLLAADREAAQWALASRLATRSDAYPVEQARYDFWPVVTPSRLQAVIGLRLAGEEGRPARPERLVDMVAGYLAVALERDRFAAEALEARVGLESERVKADLLAAVSHDLRTPLSTILFTLQSLQRFGDAHGADTRAELLALAEAETARLAGLVGNLLDMNRIDADAMAVRLAPAAAADLVAAAVQRATGALEGRPVTVSVAGTLPAVLIDFGLAETALANVIENAARYSPPGAPVEIRAAVQGDGLLIEVLDRGPGFPEPAEPLFGRFTRGVQGDGRPPGTGLGLAIARGFLTAQGGAIEATRRDDGGGALVRLRLPLAPALASAP